MISEALFNLGLVMLIIHELDAVKRKEWRIFPFLRTLEDDTGYKTFILLHIPILFILFFLNSTLLNEAKIWFQFSFDLFLIIHLVLHFIFRNDEKNQFNNRLSKSIIYITALVGTVHLMLLFYTYYFGSE